MSNILPYRLDNTILLNLLIQPLENRAEKKEGGKATKAACDHLKVFLVEDLASWISLFYRGLLAKIMALQ